MTRGAVADCAVVVTRWSMHVPRGELEAVCGEHCARFIYSADQASTVLGRKGLLGKEAATRMALGVVHTAFGTVAADRRRGPADPRVAVIVSSNLGNVATVQNIALTLRRSGIRDVSPLDAPNASSNIIASTIAIWFGFGGPNLTICSGAKAGLDAVALGCVLLRSRRAERVVVVGVEPDDASAAALYAQGTRPPRTLCAAAAAVVLERADAQNDGCPVVTPFIFSKVSHTAAERADNSIVTGASRVILLDTLIGDTYGACGVLQIAIAAALISGATDEQSAMARISCGSVEDGWGRAQLQSRAIQRKEIG